MNPAMRAFAISTALLFFKMSLNSTIQGYYRMGAKQFVHPEDAKFFGGSAGTDLPQVQRAAAVWRNDLENIPIFLFLAIAFVQVAPDANAGAYFYPFVAARYLHTFFFMNAMQPWRFLSYSLGLVVCVGLAVRILMTAL